MNAMNDGYAGGSVLRCIEAEYISVADVREGVRIGSRESGDFVCIERRSHLHQT